MEGLPWSWTGPTRSRSSSTAIPTLTCRWTRVRREGEGSGGEGGRYIQLTQLSVMSDLQALWRSVSVDGMTEADISAYLQNGELGQAHDLSHFHDTHPIPSPGTCPAHPHCSGHCCNGRKLH